MKRLFKKMGGLQSRSQTEAVAPETLQAVVPASSKEESAQWRSRGNEALAQGQLAQAIEFYRQATAVNPSDALAYINLGYGQLELKQLDTAQRSLEQAVALDPQSHDANYLLGQLFMQREEWRSALDMFQKACALRPNSEFAWRDFGAANEKLGNTAIAIDCYERAAEINSSMAYLVGNSARLAFDSGHIVKSLELSRRLLAVVKDPIDAREARYLIASALFAMGERKQAVAAMEEAQQVLIQELATTELSPDAWLRRGKVLLALRRHEEAIVAFQNYLDTATDCVDAMYLAGVSLATIGRPAEAQVLLQKALSIAPDHVAALCSMADVQLALGQCRLAIDLLKHALGLEPNNAELHWNLSIAYFLTGQLDKAWPEYEWRRHIEVMRNSMRRAPMSPYQWDGKQPLQGKSIILYGEQGLGDCIQFLRYAPLVAAQGAKVTLHLPPAVIPIADTMRTPFAQLREGDPQIAADFECALMSLPHVSGVNDIDPTAVPYIFAREHDVLRWRERLGPQKSLRVGLVWSGNADHARDRFRSLPLSALRSWAPMNIEFFSLQKEIRPADADTLSEWNTLRHFGNELNSFLDTAALAQQMDLVISVDTSVAHLVGAMGCPLWVLLTYYPDWRWMLDRTDSPWYPSATLYRQDASCTWQPVLDKIATDLAARAAAFTAPTLA